MQGGSNLVPHSLPTSTERARLGTYRGFGTERERLGTFSGLGTERARPAVFFSPVKIKMSSVKMFVNF